MPLRLDNLRAVREGQHVSLNELARRSNTAFYLLQQAESGRALAIDEAQRVAAALGVTLEELGASAL